MSDTGVAIWWVFVAGVLALVVVLVGFVVALVISQRRVIRIEREHARLLLEAQEAERAWVAREVHDDALQRVMVVRAELEYLEAETAAYARPEDARKLGALKVELDDLSFLLRRVAHRLHPTMVEKAGLVAGLRTLLDELERSLGLQVRFTAPDSPIPLELDVALAVYRIAQEALRNVARHSGAKLATLTLAVEPGWVSLRILDQGQGFTQRAGNGVRGLGLVAMQERATLAGGRFQVTSQPGQGTAVEVAFPVAGS